MISLKLLSVFVVLQYFVHLTYCQSSTKFFRKDYVYLEETRAFYKFHTLLKNFEDAKNKCQMEGATLFYPIDEDEAFVIRSYWNSTQPFGWIYIGVSTPNVQEVFETVDGLPITDVYNKWSPGQPNNLGGVQGCVVMNVNGTLNDDNCEKKFPFICKKSVDTLEWNLLCLIPDTAYEYIPKKRRCYKFHLNPLNWTDAFEVCNSEQSYLAIINDEEEAAVLANLTERAPKDTVDDDFFHGAVHLGFRKNPQWKTIKGNTLRASGYATWGRGQPDGGDDVKCGSMFYNGHLNDMTCSQRLFFICEHEIDIFNWAIVFQSFMDELVFTRDFVRVDLSP